MGIFDDIGEFFFGSDDIEVPELSPEQQRNLELQNKALEQQSQLSNLLFPLLLQEDFNVAFDDQGNITSIEPKDPTELEKNTESIQNLLAQESLKFLKGEGEIPAQVSTDFDEAREILEESLRKSLGPDFVSSTPGQDALRQFDKTKAETLEGIRFGRLRDVEALGLAREASGRDSRNSELQEFLQALNVSGAPLGGLNTAIGQSQFDRSLSTQIDIANQKQGVLGSLFSGLGEGAGAEFGKDPGGSFASITKFLGGG